MPELPEVETVRRGLAPVLTGRRVKRLELRRPDLRFPFPERFAERVAGRRIESLDRRAKYLIARIEGGETLIMHLGMTGRFSVSAPGETAHALGQYVYESNAAAVHDHVVLHIDDGTIVTYNDARRFGFMQIAAKGEYESHPLIAHLGPEPMSADFNASYLAECAAAKKVNLKALLMDQHVVAGLGNIYVCEALHMARLSPDRAAATLALRSGKPHARAAALVAAVKDVLKKAIRLGGSTLRDYRKADGSQGAFQDEFLVYGREGLPCLRDGCGGIVKRAVHSNRSTFYCPRCQR